MFGIVTRKQRHFQLYTAIYAQLLLVDEGEPSVTNSRSASQRRRDAWEGAWTALRGWEMLNDNPTNGFPRQ